MKVVAITFQPFVISLLFNSCSIGAFRSLRLQRLPTTNSLLHHEQPVIIPKLLELKLSSVGFVEDINEGGGTQIGPDETVLLPNNVKDTDTTCPFRSRFYPRYNSIRSGPKKNVSSKRKFWLPGQRSFVRYRFLYRINHHTPSSSSSEAFTKYEVEWRDDVVETAMYSGVATLATLWEIVAKSAYVCTIHNGGVNYANFTRTTTKIIAFPDANANVIQQWVHLVHSFLEQQNMTATTSDQNVFLDVSYKNSVVDFMEVPTVVLTIEGGDGIHKQPLIDSPVAHYDHDTITRRTKSWVQRLLVDQAICPFTKSATFSGQGLTDVNVPVGRIAYHTSMSTPSSSSSSCYTAAMCQLQADAWKAIYDMLQAGPTYSIKRNLNGVSSILLAAPGWDDHFAMWSGTVFQLLEEGVVIAGATEHIGIVCFHPYYQTPDGRSFPGFGHMHSVVRLQQWLVGHSLPTEIQTAIQNSLPDLLASNVIDDVGSNNTRSNTDNKNIVSALAAAGGAWQRRTPHATINVLRADQLASAEGKRSTPTLYTTNIIRLSEIGWKQLRAALHYERHMH
jgi:hypothetical protein